MSLQVWLPLNGNLNNNGTANATVTNNGATVSSSGKIGSCYSFNGSSNYVQFNYPSYGVEITFALWVKFNSAPGGVHVYEARTADSTGYQPMYITTSSIQIGCGSNYTDFSYSFTTNTWYHICVTHSAVAGKCYINGNLIGTSTTAIGQNFNSTLQARIGARFTGVNFLNGCVNDVRVYDNCLSAADVKEIAKGLVLHYPLNDGYIEPTVNYAANPYGSTYSPVSCGWNSSLHQGAIYPSNWTYGYNSGVDNPAVGYHAMWKIIDGIPTVVFNNHNSVYGYRGRWLGVASGITRISPGVKYTISFDQMTTDTLGGYTTGGIYFNKTSSSGYNFWDGCPEIGRNTKLNTWEHFSYTFTRVSDDNATGSGGSLYIYGMYGTESTMLVRNIQLELKDHGTPYAITRRPMVNNLVTGLSNGGQTTISGDSVITSGTNADTYFYLRTSAAMILDHTYRLTCYCSGCTPNQYWQFPVASQSNSAPGYLQIRNGYNELVFVANGTCVSAGTNVILDDISRPSTLTSCTFSNFCLEDVTSAVYDCSGYGNNGYLHGKNYMDVSSPRNKLATGFANSPGYDSDKCKYNFILGNCSLTTPAAITFSCWQARTSASGRGGFICTSADTNFTDYSSTALHCYDSSLAFATTGASYAFDRYNATYFPTDGSWHHYAITYSGSTAKFYRDGVLIEEKTTDGNPLRTFNYISLNYSYASCGTRNENCKMSDCRLYSTALSASDIADLYNAPIKVTKSGALMTNGEVVEE